MGVNEAYNGCLMGTQDGPRFGGSWTDQKLEVLAKYLSAYTTALKNKPTPSRPFRKAFIDGFAGTGYRASPGAGDPSTPSDLLFPELNTAERALLDGSARVALQAKPRFEKYIFIEKSRERCKQLDNLKSEFPELATDIRIHQGEANSVLRDLCKRNWSSRRAVLFLDPYGMQVEWSTLEAVARTRAIDLWLLFPLGMGVNRLLTRSAEIEPAWRRRLDILLGTDQWFDELYKIEREATLFGENERIVKASQEAIGRFFNRRLDEIFPGVAPEPGVLRNSSNSPLYLLCFAVSNEAAKKPGLRIANHLLKDLR